jgi:predicted metal-dependent phosphoesterase TrpH
MLKGVLHVHSHFSDGEESLENVVETLKRAGMQFVAVSDHAEVFNDDRVAEYVSLCAALSSSEFLVIPGLEFALQGGYIHILGYGINQRIRFKAMDELVDGIHAAGGIAVLAHPPVGCTNMIGSIKTKLDGVEVWNIRYDGVHAPRAESFQLLRRLRTVNTDIAAFCGVDLHEAAQAERPVYVEVNAAMDGHSVIDALRTRPFFLRGGTHTIPSTGDLTFIQELSIAVMQPLCRPWAA